MQAVEDGGTATAEACLHGISMPAVPQVSLIVTLYRALREVI